MNFVYDKFNNRSHDLYGVGISMGANLLLKYCGEKPDHAKFKAIISINNPWDV